MSLPRFFAPDAAASLAGTGTTGRVRLPDDEAHHLSHVLRLVVGDEVGLFDGAGLEWRGAVRTIDRAGVVIDRLRPVEPVAEPSLHLTLGQALLKGDRMDQVVRDGTALGVASIAPIATAHVATPAHALRHGRRDTRWARVAVAASKQCGRATVPPVAPIASLEHVCAAGRAGLIVMAVEPGSGEADAVDALPDLPAGSGVLVLVGPEGGWTADEIRVARQHDARCVHLGPRTLRAETAPVVLLSALWTRWGW